jgi:predicted dehydrogenase
VKIALVGLGYWGEKILRNLVAICGPDAVVGADLRRDRVEHLTRQYPGVAFSSDLSDALDDDQVRGVIIATPVESHARLTALALRAGRHVLVEKPLAATSADAAKLAELAASKGLNLMVGHTFLFSPRVKVLDDIINCGQIGHPHYVTTSRLNLGLYRSDINVIWDLAPHDFSIIFHILGEFPTRVQTMARSSVRPDIPDVAFINLIFASGVIASVVVSWRAPRKVRTTVLVGDRGMIVYDDTKPDEPIKVYDRGVVTADSASFGENQLTYRYGDTIAPHVPPKEPLLVELEHFVDSVGTGAPCRSDGWFGLEVVRALEAADRSWRIGGRPIDIEQPGTYRVVPVEGVAAAGSG